MQIVLALRVTTCYSHYMDSKLLTPRLGIQGLEFLMSLSLPLSSSPLRSMFDVAHLAEMANPSNRAKLATFRQAVQSARAMISDGVKSVNCICVTADGCLRLIQIGPRGGVKRLWNFGAL